MPAAASTAADALLVLANDDVLLEKASRLPRAPRPVATGSVVTEVTARGIGYRQRSSF